MAEIWLAFMAGLAGSTHCIGMCGGIVTALAVAGERTSPRDRHLLQLFYNLGRITTYGLLGAVAGLLGESLDLFRFTSVTRWVFAGANLFVLLVGVGTFLRFSGFSLSLLDRSCGSRFSGVLAWVVRGRSTLRAFPLGLVLGFMPCGLVYAPLVAAAGSGSPMRGILMMLALGVGTTPLLFCAGSVSALLSSWLRGNLFRAVGLFVALIGAAGLWRALAKMGYAPPFPLW